MQTERAQNARVTHNIKYEDLVKLKEVFGQEGELEEEDFVREFGQVLGDNLTETQLTHLFMKIDANSDGSVDWDEFTNYMFLNNKGAGGSDGAEEQVRWVSFGILNI